VSNIPLWKLARTIRSKNAGPFMYTFDVIFADQETYRAVTETGVLSIENVSSAFGVEVADIVELVRYAPGNAVKITMWRQTSSGDVGDGDVYGCQQYVPLLYLSVPWEDKEQ
jgi:hypothetical protein